MNDYNEPWKVMPDPINGRLDCIVDRHNNYADAPSCQSEKIARRVVECINALEGISDPKDFVERAKIALIAWDVISTNVDSQEAFEFRIGYPSDVDGEPVERAVCARQSERWVIRPELVLAAADELGLFESSCSCGETQLGHCPTCDEEVGRFYL